MNRERDLVGPIRGIVNETFDDTRADELADDPAEVDVGCEVMAKRNGTNFRCVGRRHRLEDAPGDSAEEFSCQKDTEAVGEEGHEDEACNRHESCDERPTVADSLAQETRDLQAEHFSDVGGGAKTILPGRWDG